MWVTADKRCSLETNLVAWPDVNKSKLASFVYVARINQAVLLVSRETSVVVERGHHRCCCCCRCGRHRRCCRCRRRGRRRQCYSMFNLRFRYRTLLRPDNPRQANKANVLSVLLAFSFIFLSSPLGECRQSHCQCCRDVSEVNATTSTMMSNDRSKYRKWTKAILTLGAAQWKEIEQDSDSSTDGSGSGAEDDDNRVRNRHPFALCVRLSLTD